MLLTSRNESVVGRGVKCKNFKPKSLSEPDSWTLFQRIAMPIKDASGKHLNESYLFSIFITMRYSFWNDRKSLNLTLK